MTISQRLSELLSQPREPRQGFQWALYRLVSPSLTTLEIVLAAVIIAICWLTTAHCARKQPRQ